MTSHSYVRETPEEDVEDEAASVTETAVVDTTMEVVVVGATIMDVAVSTVAVEVAMITRVVAMEEVVHMISRRHNTRLVSLPHSLRTGSMPLLRFRPGMDKAFRHHHLAGTQALPNNTTDSNVPIGCSSSSRMDPHHRATPPRIVR